MSTDHAPAQHKGDNLLGICAAVGEDFGFNPLWLRIAFATGLLWNLEAMIAGYLVLGVIVAASRLLFPNRKRHSATVVALPQQPAAQPDLPLAA